VDEPVVPSLEQLRRRQSAKWQLHPPDVLPLPVAEMDFELAEPVKAALREAVERSDTGYAMPGPRLGAALAGFAERRWGWRPDPARARAVTDVGVGAVELLRTITGPGDTVLISPPVYPPFFGWVGAAGARLREVPLRRDAEHGWRLDLPALDAAFAQGAAAYVLCNPHNPVGRVHTPDELAQLVASARRHGVTIVSDEIHAPLTLPGATFTPLLTVPGAAEVSLSLVSASKAWNLAGLKCALIVSGSPAGDRLLDRLPEDLHWHAGHFGVIASIAAFEHGETWLDGVLGALDARRSRLDVLLRERLPRVRWHPPEATYLAWLDCRALGDGDGPHELFLAKARVALEPGTHFGASGNGHVRLNFATSAQILDQAVTAMAGAVP
jgi:cystathionine beta-lyase